MALKISRLTDKVIIAILSEQDQIQHQHIKQGLNQVAHENIFVLAVTTLLELQSQ